MDLKNYLLIDDKQRPRFEEMYARYKLLHQFPDRARPMIIIETPVPNFPAWEERLADPSTMLKAELDMLRPHLEIRDDRAPTVRVQFGTAQIAAAFGCPMHIPPNSLPAAGAPVLKRAEDVYQLGVPALDDGWYGKLADWTALWKKNLPEGVQIQHPDIQSAFNSAHLIRGNDIFTDFYDHPEEVDRLLDLVTDFMIGIARRAKTAISNDAEWFFDWGALWKGYARISNCSMHMISPDFYRTHVLPRDIRFFQSVGGGRMHYCGTAGEVIADFFKIPLLTGIDIDCRHHDFFALSERVPSPIVLLATFEKESGELNRLLAGGWPKKRNIIVIAPAADVEEGKALLAQLRRSCPY